MCYRVIKAEDYVFTDEQLQGFLSIRRWKKTLPTISVHCKERIGIALPAYVLGCKRGLQLQVY